jgi:hypothetical protein
MPWSIVFDRVYLFDKDNQCLAKDLVLSPIYLTGTRLLKVTLAIYIRTTFNKFVHIILFIKALHW